LSLLSENLVSKFAFKFSLYLYAKVLKTTQSGYEVGLYKLNSVYP
jgi:hypothetical protein